MFDHFFKDGVGFFEPGWVVPADVDCWAHEEDDGGNEDGFKVKREECFLEVLVAVA